MFIQRKVGLPEGLCGLSKLTQVFVMLLVMYFGSMGFNLEPLLVMPAKLLRIVAVLEDLGSSLLFCCVHV